ncbi:PIG-L deacetylase family protein [Natrononativus amylolyticus]|uniref:PIG-L deacetylase family protein n=1 Tax=Natrononativus amylolyticus TaxID=2963434 RepID=UPI0020CDEAE7|nr:PIG-L family deacetylase [Natrononativus amylolyticus]
MSTADPDAIADEPLTVLVIGAHIDDCDIKVGGTASLWADRGHDVTFVSLTNGEAGHHEIGGLELTRTRRAEGRAAADVLGVDFVSLDIIEGKLRPTIENRNKVIRLIREHEPDLVLTHRPNDYHPDHRYGSDLVQDAAYMVTVPSICPDTPHLQYNPIICYLEDDFRKPYPFEADVVVDIDDAIERKLDAIHRHESQMYEWLPYNQNVLEEVPEGDEARREWLAETRAPDFEAVADRFREDLIERYGEERGSRVQYAEAFEECEYGGTMTAKHEELLFPF